MQDEAPVQWKRHLRIDIPVLLVMTMFFFSVFVFVPSMRENMIARIFAMCGMIYFFGKFVWAGAYMIGALLTAGYRLSIQLLIYALVMLVFMFLSIRLIIMMLELI